MQNTYELYLSHLTKALGDTGWKGDGNDLSNFMQEAQTLAEDTIGNSFEPFNEQFKVCERFTFHRTMRYDSYYTVYLSDTTIVFIEPENYIGRSIESHFGAVFDRLSQYIKGFDHESHTMILLDTKPFYPHQQINCLSQGNHWSFENYQGEKETIAAILSKHTQ
jgi:hypothetical protein